MDTTSDPWAEATAELERMATAASASDALESESFPTDEQIGRWQKVFGYTRREAFGLIKAQRSDLTRSRITDEHWELVREEQVGRGGDRETYEVCLRASESDACERRVDLSYSMPCSLGMCSRAKAPRSLGRMGN